MGGELTDCSLTDARNAPRENVAGPDPEIIATYFNCYLLLFIPIGKKEKKDDTSEALKTTHWN